MWCEVKDHIRACGARLRTILGHVVRVRDHIRACEVKDHIRACGASTGPDLY